MTERWRDNINQSGEAWRKISQKNSVAKEEESSAKLPPETPALLNATTQCRIIAVGRLPDKNEMAESADVDFPPFDYPKSI